MSELYSAKVIKKTEDAVCLEVQVVHPDSMYIPADKSFALGLLYDTAQGKPLGEAMSLDELLDTKWVSKYAAGFIASVSVSNLKNVPPKEAQDNSRHSYWNEPDGWLKGTLDVKVTHPAWIAHLKAKQHWDSAAFEVTSEYDECAPISPEDDKTTLPQTWWRAEHGSTQIPKKQLAEISSRIAELRKTGRAECLGDEAVLKELGAGTSDAASIDGFLLLPRECSSLDDMTLPPLLEFPRYAGAAYRLAEKIKNPSKAQLTQLNGLAVEVKGRYSADRGAFVVDGSRVAVLTLSPQGSSGYSCGGISDIEWVGRLELKPKARLSLPIAYESVLAKLLSTVVDTKIKGSTATLTIRCPPTGGPLSIERDADVLRALALPVCEHGDEPTGRSPLALALLAEPLSVESSIQANSSEVRDLWDQVAKGYVAKWKLTKPKRKKTPALEGKTRVELAAYFDAASWPIATLEVTMTDKAWLQHLTKKTSPYRLPGYAVSNLGFKWTQGKRTLAQFQKNKKKWPSYDGLVDQAAVAKIRSGLDD